MAARKDLTTVNNDRAAPAMGRKLNNRGRALVHDALERLTRGDLMDARGDHGRTFPDQLAHELLASPLASLLRIDAATPCDEGVEGKGAGGIKADIGALYLQVVQAAGKQAGPVIEGTIGVQPEPGDW
jgi:hypothetical protein